MRKLYKSTAIVLLISLLICSGKAFPQPALPRGASPAGNEWYRLMQDPNATFSDVVRAANLHFSQKNTDQKGIGYKVFKRWEYINESRVLPDGRLQDDGYILREYNRYMQELDGAASVSGNWSIVGPVTYPTNATVQPTGMGRINAIAFHPSDANVIFIGAPSGGIWKTSDGGSTWTDLSSNIPKLGVSAILVHPVNPSIIYIGTGDRDASDAPGIGVYKSTDGGSTWSQINNTMGNVKVGAMVMHPDDPNILLAATSGGIYKSTNAGVNWTIRSANTSFYKDIKFKPGNPNIVYATEGGRFYRSSDAGNNWTQITSGILSGQRLVIGVSPDNPEFVYLCQTANDELFAGVMRSVDAGLTFSTRGTSPNIFDYACDGSGTSSQATYDLCITVDPDDANVVYIGSINNWKSTDGGSTWTICSHWVGSTYGTTCAASVHADQHWYEWSPLNGRLYVGNDGGLYYTADGGVTWPQISSGIAIAQVYRIGQSATNTDMVIQGYQDNGSAFSNGSSFTTVGGGDGAEGAIDYTNTNYRYKAGTTGTVTRTTTGGNSYSTIAGKNSNGITGESSYWLPPFSLHETDPNVMFLGYMNVYRSDNVKSTPSSSVAWSAISSGETGTCRVLEQSPADLSILYAFRTGSLKRSDNATATPGSVTWTPCTLPGGSEITDLEAHYSNANIIYATAGYKAYKSSDKGMTWTDISANLPALFINTLVCDKNANEGIYVGNQTGVWYKDATMTNWILFSNGLPPVDVRELEIYYDAVSSNNRIKAGTYGRGLWKSDLVQMNVIDPSNVTAFVAGSSQINLGWTKNAANDNVVVAWSSTGTFGQPTDGNSYSSGNPIPGGGTVLYSGSASAYEHTGLTASTLYYYKVWSVSGSNQYSAGVLPVSATTDCPAIASFPYTCSFDNTSCWQVIDNTGNRSWQFGSSTNSNNPPTILSAPYAYFKSSAGTAVNFNSDLISPPMNLSAMGNVVLRFNHHYDGDAVWSSTARVYYTTDNGLNWNLIATYTTDQNNTTTTLVVPGAAGQSNVKFRWNYFDDATGSYFWGIDDVEVKECSGVWTGSVSTNWHTAGNWCNNSVPDATTDVFIPGGVTNMPDISTTAVAYCRDITIQSGATLKMSAANSILEVRGNWTMYGSFNYGSSSSSSMVKFNGSSPQVIGGSGNTRLNGFTIDNSSGVTLSTELRADNAIRLVNGIVTTTGTGKVYDVYSVIIRTNGWVNGTLQKYAWSANGSVENRTFEIGDATAYSPVTLSFPVNSITGTGPLSMKTTTGDHPNIGSSSLDGSLSVNRFWSFPATVSFTSCTATFNFVSSDLDAGTITGNLNAGQYRSGAWSYPATGTKTSTSVQVTGLSSSTLGEIQLAENVSAIDWANLQWPSAGTIDLGNTFSVYARVYEPTVTPGAGQGSGVQCWIGYSAANTDPSGWTNWVPAAYNTDDGNNDEYVANLGMAIPSGGTYYYASRFRRGSSAYVYGGFQGGFWNGTSNVSGTLTVNVPQPDWVNLQYPASGSIAVGGSLPVYAQVYEPGITNSAGQGAGIQCWIGYSAANSDPATWTDWVAALYNSDNGNNDEYTASIGSALPAGTYYYASRFRLGVSPYVYGGLTGFWSSGNSGVLSVLVPTFTGTGNWAEAARWNTGAVPSGTDHVIIDGTCTVTGAVTTAGLTIQATRNLTVAASGTLTVTGTLVNNAGTAGLAVKSDATGTGSLIHHTTDVDATFERYMNNADWNDWKDGWHFISSPVLNQSISPAFTVDPYDFYCWYEPQNLWVNYKNTTTPPTFLSVNGSGNFSMGRGYLADYDEAGVRSFSGKLNVGDVPVSGLGVTGSGANTSWHLLGNPFGSALAWDASSAWNLSNIAGVAKIWNEANQSYSDITSSPAGYIPATNGFMVQVLTAPGSMSIPAANRTHSSVPFYKESIPELMLTVRNTQAGNAQEIRILEHPASTGGFDPMLDGEFLQGYGPGFYSLAGNRKLSTDAFPSRALRNEIPLGFEKNEGTGFSITANGAARFGGTVWLDDLKTGAGMDLRYDTVYHFSAAAGDNPERFRLRFLTAGSGEILTGHRPFAWYHQGTIHIQASAGVCDVLVLSVTGQNVFQAPQAERKVALRLSPGVYQARITGQAKSCVIRFIVEP